MREVTDIRIEIWKHMNHNAASSEVARRIEVHTRELSRLLLYDMVLVLR